METIYTISKNDNIHFYKKIYFNIKNNYKNVIYFYDILNDNQEIIKTVKHNYINKPAEILYSNNEIRHIEFWYHNKIHRDFGPAIISYNNKKIVFEEWYHHNTKLTDIEIKNIITVIERKKKMHQLITKYF